MKKIQYNGNSIGKECKFNNTIIYLEQVDYNYSCCITKIWDDV